MKKVKEVKQIFSYKKTSCDQNKIYGLTPLNPINQKARENNRIHNESKTYKKKE